MNNNLPKLRFGVIGIDHRHIYDQVSGLLLLGAECVGYWTKDDSVYPMKGFIKRFPHIKKIHDRFELLENKDIQLIVIASIPNERAGFAIEAMRHHKDVMVDKPGVTTMEQLTEIIHTQQATGRIFSINFSERFEVKAVSKATELIKAGTIGQVLQTTGLGPHRLNRHTRADWFFNATQYGGILADIASHQIDQFLHFTGADDARIVLSRLGNLAHQDVPEFEDFGEIVLSSGIASGYIRVDWFTPDALPVWGDGRLIILGTEGYIELRKYVDITARPGKDHLFLVNNSVCQYIDCADADLPYYRNLYSDIFNRTQTAMSQTHCFKVCELALKAQLNAERIMP